jgi:hypothetical protein
MKTPEDLAKAFSDTQAELTRAKQELAKVAKPPEEKKAGDTKDAKKPGDMEVPDDKAAEALAAVDFTPYSEEFHRTGDVAPENRAKVAESLKSIFGDHAADIVNDYVEGRKTSRANTTKALKDLAGGDDGYGSMVAWAKDNIPAEERAAYNRAVNSGDYHAASLAVAGLHAKYQAKTGKAPSLVTGDGINTSVGFASLHQLVTAQRDPRYGKDPDYTKGVQEKLKISQF